MSIKRRDNGLEFFQYVKEFDVYNDDKDFMKTFCVNNAMLRAD